MGSQCKKLCVVNPLTKAGVMSGDEWFLWSG